MNNLDALKHAVPVKTLERALSVSQRLTELGVRHVLIGGLAVGVHGHPRATKDVDFLVGDEAFASTILLTYRDELVELVELAVTDLLAVPRDYPSLERELQLSEDLNVISLEALILMKLHAGRTQDVADVEALTLVRQEARPQVVAYLRKHAPELLPKYARILSRVMSSDT